MEHCTYEKYYHGITTLLEGGLEDVKTPVAKVESQGLYALFAGETFVYFNRKRKANGRVFLKKFLIF